MTAAPITPAAIAAATAGSGPLDLGALERAFDAFVLFPAGDGLSGFDGPDAMVIELTDGVSVHLAGDLNPLPEPVLNACRDIAATFHGTLFGFTYKDAAEMAIRSWQGLRERFSADCEAAR